MEVESFSRYLKTKPEQNQDQKCKSGTIPIVSYPPKYRCNCSESELT